jgi:hypothetical protein
MSAATAWIIMIIWFIIPILHVVTSIKGGSWHPPKGSTCPFGPRTGWLIIVLLLGLVGWAIFLRAKRVSQSPNI